MEEAERAVIQAFHAAAREGKAIKDCYLAAVTTWQAFFPDQTSGYARQCAVRVVLAARARKLMGAYGGSPNGAPSRAVEDDLEMTETSDAL